MSAPTATSKMIAESLLPEFDQEMQATRAVLEQVPNDKLDFKPHEKSMTLRRLAAHVAEVPDWTEVMLEQDEFDIAPASGSEYKPAETESTAKLLKDFDATVAKARKAIAAKTDEEYMKPWTLKKGGEKLFSAPRIGVVRRQLMNHLVHHRGQLTVYLRLVGAKVPQTFGPTADYPDFG